MRFCKNCGHEATLKSDTKDIRYICENCGRAEKVKEMKLDKIYAYIAMDNQGNEAIVAASIGEIIMPLVMGDRLRVESYREIALEVGRTENVPIRLVEFTKRSDIERVY
ncbi:hypothetical protein LCGC14_0452210 [marine sediment metagenome]|uniref:Uncharacterized protein n=1 Tax=marine sediment metagenome TaxID=412755 RepID=A0A0F9SHG8_9ZZZZ